MKLRALVIALVLAHSSPALPMDDQAAVAATLDAYAKALIDGDGASASAMTSSGSHTLLRDGVGQALTIGSRELRRLPPLEQLAVLLLRHSMGGDHIRNMNATDPIEYAVKAHVFDVFELAEAEIDKVYIEGDEAQAFLSHAKKFPPYAAIFLKKEGGTWRIDLVGYLTQFVPVGVIYNPNAVSETTDIETKIMSSTIAWITGRAPDANIWNPPG